MKLLFSANLKELRKSEGLLQRELAEKLGTTERKISYLENGKYEPDLQMLWKIADYFDVSCDELIGRKEL